MFRLSLSVSGVVLAVAVVLLSTAVAQETGIIIQDDAATMQMGYVMSRQGLYIVCSYLMW